VSQSEELPEPVSVPVPWLRKEAEFQFDANTRTLTVVVSGGLDLQPTRTSLAFALIKQAAGQILLWEVQLEKDKLAKGEELIVSQQFKEKCAKSMIRDGELEIAAIQKARERKDKEYVPPQLPGFDI
jgi:hypothetical protein